MGIPQTPNPPHVYSQALQLKLYQAFIFSIPILFSIILILLFYLFYLKKRASSFSAPPPQILPTTLDQASSFILSPCDVSLKGEIRYKLSTVLFDEDLKAKDSICCVCLGEFDIKEELLQVVICKHLFHSDCIRHWLHSNSTCPLCRSPVGLADTKIGHHHAPETPQPPPPPPPELPLQQFSSGGSNITDNDSRLQQVIVLVESLNSLVQSANQPYELGV